MFHDYAPCSDSAQGRGDPLLEMEILGTINNGIKGGDYGYGRGSFHNGIDLACPVGTPVFATMEGVVTRVKHIPHGTYEEVGHGMSISDFGTGNAVYITAIINGKEYTSFYWHLDEIYVNKNDYVSVGTIIGTSGITGNASSDKCAGPHLHYGVKYGGSWSVDYLNPETFLYADFNKEGKNINDCNN